MSQIVTAMSHLVKRLREFPQFVRFSNMSTWFQGHGNDPLCAEAADAIEQLSRELAEARANFASLKESSLAMLGRAEKAEAGLDALQKMLSDACITVDAEYLKRLKGYEAENAVLKKSLEECRESINCGYLPTQTQLEEWLEHETERANIAEARLAESRIKYCDDGTLDEIVGPNGHIEKMDTNHWFLQIGDYAVWLYSSKPIHAAIEHRPETSPQRSRTAAALAATEASLKKLEKNLQRLSGLMPTRVDKDSEE